MRRIYVLSLLFSLFVGAIVVKLFYIQVLASSSYTPNNYLRSSRIEPARGNIYDRNKEPLAVNQSYYTLFSEPKNVTDSRKLLMHIDEVTHIGEATLEGRFKKEKQWVPLAFNLTEDQKKDLEKREIAGIGFDEYKKRYYPEASIAAQLLGFVGKDDEGDSVGYFGIEGYYHKDLEGLPGILKTERDIIGRPIVIGTQNRLKGENGRDLVLTIDKTSQMIVKRELKAAIEQYRAKSGCVTVANPNTGEILAMTCLPDFDPDEYAKFTQHEFRNPIISDTFEPGSIFKPLIVAAALEEKAIKADDTYDEKGPIRIGQYYVSTWNDEYNGIISISRILQTSSNVGMVHIGEKLGNEKILAYLGKYGLGKETGIDLQGEVSPNLKPKKSWYPIDFATVTFGQGIAVSQIQMITAFSSLVNGGWLVKPFVVKELIGENGEVKKIESKKIRQIISEKTSKEIRKMLEETVKHGEAKWKVPDGYRIGGKTGTAQIALAGKYDATKTNASYIGFAPVSNPQFIMLVTLNQPETSQWASETAAPLFFKIAKDLFVEYNIAPN
ncbi:penicillin-binding protein 2 [Candidatus Woesebacteria bacterium]|nr:penicillin-binding protein 2 [Candidatus Woesebacteria bacterium]